MLPSNSGPLCKMKYSTHTDIDKHKLPNGYQQASSYVVTALALFIMTEEQRRECVSVLSRDPLSCIDTTACLKLQTVAVCAFGTHLQVPTEKPLVVACCLWDFSQSAL